jgi:hypothetical protein
VRRCFEYCDVYHMVCKIKWKGVSYTLPGMYHTERGKLWTHESFKSVSCSVTAVVETVQPSLALVNQKSGFEPC